MSDGVARHVPASSLRAKYYPETAIDDSTRIDNAVEFYTRVNALLSPTMTVVDFGAGRGQWYYDRSSKIRRQLRDLRGKTHRVIGLDIDEAVVANPSVDDAYIIQAGRAFPLQDASIDLIVSDWTFEHIVDPASISAELNRILRPGGWICARTPNRYGYIGVAARLIPNGWHARWLKRLQPARNEIDVFPVRYRLNTSRSVSRYFPPDKFYKVVYAMPAEPGYAGESRLLWSMFELGRRIEPRSLHPVLSIFLRKY